MKKLMVLCVLGLAVLIVANNETFAKPQEQGVKKCNDGRDNDGDELIDGADPGCQNNIEYTAARTIGVLSFDAVVVTPNGTESDLFPVSGTADLDFFRPGPSSSFLTPYIGECVNAGPDRDACDAWDAVIENCDHLRDSGVTGANVPRFTVKADNLSFGRGGGVRIRFGGIDVLDAYDPDGDLFMGLHLELIGDCFNTNGCTDTFLPAVGDDPSIFILTHFWLTGHTEMKGKKGHCNRDGHEGSLVNVPPNTPFSNLVITAEAVEE